MTSKQLGHLKRLEPREVWTSEPKDFTPWLADRIDLLSEALGIEIELIGRKKWPWVTSRWTCMVKTLVQRTA